MAKKKPDKEGDIQRDLEKLYAHLDQQNFSSIEDLQAFLDQMTGKRIDDILPQREGPLNDEERPAPT